MSSRAPNPLYTILLLILIGLLIVWYCISISPLPGPGEMPL